MRKYAILLLFLVGCQTVPDIDTTVGIPGIATVNLGVGGTSEPVPVELNPSITAFYACRERERMSENPNFCRCAKIHQVVIPELDCPIVTAMPPLPPAPAPACPECEEAEFDYFSPEARDMLTDVALGDIDGYRIGDSKENAGFIWARVRQNSPLGDKIIVNEKRLP